MSRGSPPNDGPGVGVAGGCGGGSTVTGGGSETKMRLLVRLSLICGCGGVFGPPRSTVGILEICHGKYGKLGSGRMVQIVLSKPAGRPDASCWLVMPVPPPGLKDCPEV